jgi:pyridoxamine 5'-phosphate oxidase-like protein
VGVRLSDDQAWQAVEQGHTGILTTLRRDGWPISLPVWFTVLDRAVFVRTPMFTKKVIRVRHDERACFLVETGLSWQELRAVVLPVRATIVEDTTLAGVLNEAIERKYRAFRTAQAEMPKATRSHYDVERAFIRLDPTGRILSWDNARIALDDASA